MGSLTGRTRFVARLGPPALAMGLFGCDSLLGLDDLRREDAGVDASTQEDSGPEAGLDAGVDTSLDTGLDGPSEVGQDADAATDGPGADTFVPPECVKGSRDASPSCNGNCGAGLSCGQAGDIGCCLSVPVEGGSFFRSYDGVGFKSKAYPAAVSAFQLDTFEVSVGRFRNFVVAVEQGWTPPSGSGKHAYLNGGQGLVIPGGNESGWNTSWNKNLPTTVASWDAALMMCTPSTWTSTPTDPGDRRAMNCVDWYEAYAFCIFDEGFLPSEAEWNYAAAGGSEHRVYPWKGTVVTTSDANFNKLVSMGPSAIEIVGQNGPSGNGFWGGADLAGNVQEWCLDYLATADGGSQDSYPQAACTDCAFLPGTTSLTHRVVRGGAFDDTTDQSLDTSARGEWSVAPSSARSEKNGVRCVRPPG